MFFNAALLCGQDLDLLLHLHDLGALVVGGGLGGGNGVFQVRQLLRLLFNLRGEQLGLFIA